MVDEQFIWLMMPKDPTVYEQSVVACAAGSWVLWKPCSPEFSWILQVWRGCATNSARSAILFQRRSLLSCEVKPEAKKSTDFPRGDCDMLAYCLWVIPCCICRCLAIMPQQRQEQPGACGSWSWAGRFQGSKIIGHPQRLQITDQLDLMTVPGDSLVSQVVSQPSGGRTPPSAQPLV